jgi:hypothetical protein
MLTHVGVSSNGSEAGDHSTVTESVQIAGGIYDEDRVVIGMPPASRE